MRVLPVIRGLIDRRILVNFAADPEMLARQLPAPFRPRMVRGMGMAGICLIRLKEVRPKGFPRLLGLSSENAAHRIAVEWDQDGVSRQGVFIVRRDTSLWLNSMAGGRVFPGVHHRARFEICEQQDRYDIRLDSDDGQTCICVAGQRGVGLPAGSIFASLAEASAFFEAGSVGYSPSRRTGAFDGLELRTLEWQVEPLELTRCESSFFDDVSRFPPGSVKLDHALLMRQVEHEWHRTPSLEPQGLCVPGQEQCQPR